MKFQVDILFFTFENAKNYEQLLNWFTCHLFDALTCFTWLAQVVIIDQIRPPNPTLKKPDWVRWVPRSPSRPTWKSAHCLWRRRRRTRCWPWRCTVPWQSSPSTGCRREGGQGGRTAGPRRSRPPLLQTSWKVNNVYTPQQDKTAILGEISPIFHSFYTYFPPMVPHLPFFRPHVYGIHLFPPISAYFPPKMVPHPCYKLKHYNHLLFFHPHVPIFHLYFTHFPPIFCLTFCPKVCCKVKSLLSYLSSLKICKTGLLIYNIHIILSEKRICGPGLGGWQQ